MAKQIQSLTIMNVKIEQTERVEMKILSKEKDNPTVEALSDDNDKAKYISKRIYINYENKNWIIVCLSLKINMYQQMTKSKKFELLKIKSELQQCFQESRMTLMELINNNDIDDNDKHEYEQLFFTISQKNVDDFINGRLTRKLKK